jgi:hypothetical protein
MPRIPPPRRWSRADSLAGGAAAAVVNVEDADRRAREVGPVALELEQAGLSLRDIGRELSRRNLPPRNGCAAYSERPCTVWAPSSVRSLLRRYWRLLAATKAAEPGSPPST